MKTTTKSSKRQETLKQHLVEKHVFELVELLKETDVKVKGEKKIKPIDFYKMIIDIEPIPEEWLSAYVRALELHYDYLVDKVLKMKIKTEYREMIIFMLLQELSVAIDTFFNLNADAIEKLAA